MEEDELNAIKFDISLFWKLENFANLEGAHAVEPNDRFDSFEEEISRLPDGRYCTPLPWTTDRWRLERNFHLTAGKLESTLARLRKTPQDLADYSNEIQQLIDKQFVEKADMEFDGHYTYVPHHPVFRRDKQTTKIRPVFEGAAKSKYGPSLNEVLEPGPNLNPDLLSTTMRFRMNRYAWIADIEKAFLNIALQQENAESIRFLWASEPSKIGFPLIAFKWLRVPFGLSPSPFLLRAAINKHLKSVESRFPDTVNQLMEQLYVDDYLGGADEIETA